MQKTKIDWGVGQLWTWNPVTGCKRGCEYCYAKKIHDRFNKTQFTDITPHVSRIHEPMEQKKPCTIFVGSMSDIQYWGSNWIGNVLAICNSCPQHTFMFLSKNPASYSDNIWPKNTMQGLTLTCTQTDHCQIEMVLAMIKLPRPFLSIEPLLGELMVHRSGLKYFEKIIVGAQTGPGAIPPKPEWMQSIMSNCPADKIFWKDSIKKLVQN